MDVMSALIKARRELADAEAMVVHAQQRVERLTVVVAALEYATTAYTDEGVTPAATEAQPDSVAKVARPAIVADPWPQLDRVRAVEMALEELSDANAEEVANFLGARGRQDQAGAIRNTFHYLVRSKRASQIGRGRFGPFRPKNEEGPGADGAGPSVDSFDVGKEVILHDSDDAGHRDGFSGRDGDRERGAPVTG